jgi:hypothetical protein
MVEDGCFKLTKSMGDKKAIVFNLKRDMVFIDYTTDSPSPPARSQNLKIFREALVRCSLEQIPIQGKKPLQMSSKAGSSSQSTPIQINPLNELRAIALDHSFLCWDASKPLTAAEIGNFGILNEFKELELIFVFESHSPMMSETFDLDLVPQPAW